MELYALPALILALIGLIGLRKENNGKDKTITDYINQYKSEKKKKQNEQVYKSKARKARDEYKKELKRTNIMLDLSCRKVDESKVVMELLLTKVKKSEMESAKKAVKDYYKM